MKKLLLSLISVTTLSITAQDTVYVNQNATGTEDGTSWSNAYTSLKFATDDANQYDQIWVAAGTYLPSDSSDRHNGFEPEAAMYGGFNGTETQLSQRDWIANPTILSGDIGVVGDSSDNSYTVVLLSGSVASDFSIDGFTISDGYAELSTGATVRNGAGIYMNNFAYDITIKNCIIKNNTAHYGGGFACYYDNSGPQNVTIENTRFTNNFARTAAGFSFHSNQGVLNATLINCLVDNNATGDFKSEAAQSNPGGRYLQTSTGSIDATVINCTFSKNSEYSSINNASRSLIQARETGSGSIDIVVYNSVFYDNNVNTLETSLGYGSSASQAPSSLAIYNSIYEDVYGIPSYVTSVNNLYVDPVFTNSSTADFTLQSTSPAINAGTTSGITALIPSTDYAGNNRLNGTIDIGCYEYNQVSTGVENKISLNIISIYPNPASSQLSINTGASTIESILVIDITGKTIKSIIPTSNTIDVSDLTEGIFILQVKTEEGVFTNKFIKE